MTELRSAAELYSVRVAAALRAIVRALRDELARAETESALRLWRYKTNAFTAGSGNQRGFAEKGSTVTIHLLYFDGVDRDETACGAPFTAGTYYPEKATCPTCLQVEKTRTGEAP